MISRPQDDNDGNEGSFIRVRVTNDVSKPLCCGRIISLANGRA